MLRAAQDCRFAGSSFPLLFGLEQKISCAGLCLSARVLSVPHQHRPHHCRTSDTSDISVRAGGWDTGFHSNVSRKLHSVSLCFANHCSGPGWHSAGLCCWQQLLCKPSSKVLLWANSGFSSLPPFSWLTLGLKCSPPFACFQTVGWDSTGFEFSLGCGGRNHFHNFCWDLPGELPCDRWWRRWVD